jgi:uncharacterized SAM-binding protein YcdF (DUF218 family)
LKKSSLFAYLFLSWGIGFFIFIVDLPTHKEESRSLTDMVVVYTGGVKRIATGFNLIREHKAKRLLISGVIDESYVKDIMAHQFNTPADQVILGFEADNTHENALETRYYANLHQAKSLRLVTSFYHMPRSLIETQFLLPHLKIIPHPVFWNQKSSLSWYKKILYLFSEYNKYLVIFLKLKIKKVFFS